MKKRNKELIVSEVFYSIQGEGLTSGHPAVFLRLAGCNLLCKSQDWICDTIEVWQKGVSTPFANVIDNEKISRLRNGAILVITGGEPLLHQKTLAEYLLWFQRCYSFKPKIEIETNGTIKPSFDLIEFVSHWNCSPKFANSGEPLERRFNKEAIKAINSLNNSTFKFVVSKKEDITDIMNDYGYIVDKKKIIIMPAGENQKQLSKTRFVAAKMSIDFGLIYSDRLHINIWNEKTGV